ncbi:hypothetical protein PTKIN_Ptkin02bG0241400 [Pterospermum kingtungense]
MERIFEKNLGRSDQPKITFNYNGGSLPRGSSVLCVRDGTRTLSFECKEEGGNRFCISGAGWRDFASRRINSTVTLSKDEDGHFYVS